MALFKLLPYSTALILPLYKLAITASRMIDFTITINPPLIESATIWGLIREDHGQSINQKGVPALFDKPVAISIEVKRTNNGANKAKLQLAVWLAAH
jgi:hypothetical protein